MAVILIHSEEYIDLTFKLRGAPIPLDNGYAIYSALSSICPSLHELKSIGIHPIAGIPTRNNLLELTAQSCLKIRIYDQQIPLIYPYLAGQAFHIGQNFYQLDIPDYKPLISSESVYSRLVIIKGFQDSTSFLEAVQRQMDNLGIQGKIELLTRQDGTPQRRQLTIKKEGKQFKIRGFGVKISELNPEDSLILQERRDYVQITSWLYLGGIVRHARTQNTTKLEEKPEYALTLLFVPVVCHYCLFHILSEDLKEKKPHRYLVVIPEIQDFEDASQRRWGLQQLETKQLHISSLEEASLLYYSLDDVYTEGSYYQACQVWLYEKMNQASHQKTLMRVEEIKIDKNTLITYQQAQKYFQPNYQRVKPKQIFITVNPIRSLIADNLVKGNHWWSSFWEKLVIEDSKGYLFNQLFSNREGFIIMAENSEEDKQYLIFIKVFQQAMKGSFAKIYAKTEEGKEAPIKKRFERLRAELNTCYDELSFQEYLSDFLVRGGINKYFNQHQEEIALLIKKSSWQELRVWALLAIASYKPKAKTTNKDNSLSPNNQQLEDVNDESEEE